MKLKTTSGTEFYIDDEDYNTVKEYNWHDLNIVYKSSYKRTYIRCRKGCESKQLARLIMDPPENKVIDHIDNNPLNNRKTNLRICTQADNLGNRKSTNKTSRFKGVSRSSKNGKNCKWRAQITKNGKCYNLGRFATEKQAAIAYDKKAKELHGEFARTNHDLGLL